MLTISQNCRIKREICNGTWSGSQIILIANTHLYVFTLIEKWVQLKTIKKKHDKNEVFFVAASSILFGGKILWNSCYFDSEIAFVSYLFLK